MSDLTSVQIADLRESVLLENESDLYALAFDFGAASSLMRRANDLRRKVFGSLVDPNELRDRTREALGPYQQESRIDG